MFPAWFSTLSDWLLVVMQFSIIVPMVVVWRRQACFPPVIRLLSWYVYLSATSVVALRYLAQLYAVNHLYITNASALIGFNYGKIILFGLVYARSTEHPQMRRLIGFAAGATVVAGLLLWPAPLLTPSVILNKQLVYARTVQCVLLAAFALLYIEQFARINFLRIPTQDPIYLLSIGQLLYSAGTVASFSYSLFYDTAKLQAPVYIFVAIMGLVFNYFLTLALLRAHPNPPAAQVVATSGQPVGT